MVNPSSKSEVLYHTKEIKGTKTRISRNVLKHLLYHTKEIKGTKTRTLLNVQIR